MNKMAEQISELGNVIKRLAEMQEDNTVPRNIRIKIESLICFLEQDAELPIKLNKAISELEGVASDVNLQSYARTQIWNIMSELEKL